MISIKPEIIYEDKNFIGCIKPVGVLSEKGGMPDILDEYLRDSGEKGSVYCIHRLDRDVSGVMIFAKNQKAASALSKLIGERKISKEYLATVFGKPEEENGCYTDLLFKDSAKNKSYVVKRMRRGVKEAKLEYQVLKTASLDGNNVSLVHIKLHTGRTHQIRVQFASRKMPLLGDRKYGSGFSCPIALWSYKICFMDPFTGKDVVITRLPNEVYPWTAFKI